MSLFKTIKRAFGYDADDEEEYNIDDPDEAIENETSQSDTTSESNNNADTIVEPERPTIDPNIKGQIFDGVLAIFNQSLPDFLARCVDSEAQKRVLVESLDKSIDDYLNNLLVQAEQYAEQKLKNETDTSRRETERLRTEMQQLEQQRTSLREQQLSADRRRRALADRVTDLEAQLANADAEREQLQLENKSMLNKLKVADVQPAVVEEMSRRIEELQAQLNERCNSQSAPAPATSENDNSEALAEAQRAAEEAKAALEEANNAANEAKTALEEANNATNEAKTALEEANNERNKAIEIANKANEEVATLKAGINDLHEQAELSQTMYNDLQKKYADERTARQDLETQLDEAKKVIEQINEMQEQFKQVETLIRKRDERIEKLKAGNKRLRDDLNATKARLASMDEANLFGYAQTEATEPTKAPDPLPPLEDDFEMPDWFACEPDSNAPNLRADEQPFGYTEPAKKPRKPDSDAQMSLF